MPGAYSELNRVEATNQTSAATSGEALEQWWTTFHDPQLNSLIHRAIEGNRDLQMALSRVREARAQRGVIASGLWPEIDLTAGYNRSRGSKNVRIPLGGLGGGSGSAASANPVAAVQRTEMPSSEAASGTGSGRTGGVQPGGPLGPFGKGGLPGVTTDLYQAGFDSSWELDIFGGTRRAIEAASADIAAAVEDRRSVLVSLLGEVAGAYIQRRSTQQRLGIAMRNLGAQRETLAIIQARFKAGLGTDLELAQQSAQVASTEAMIPGLQSAERNALHTLAFLIGRNPDELTSELASPKPLPSTPPQMPVGLPSDLLQRRPDVRQAERRLAAATARVGAAGADLFPRFNLTGAFGFDSSKANNLFDWQSRYFAINPGVSWPLLDWGRIRNNVKVQNERQRQALIGYENTVQGALKEVEDALVNFQNEQVRRTALVEVVEQSRKSFELARQRYGNGLIDFLTVLEAQRSLLAAEDALAQSEASVRTAVISLYKALGGGWEEMENSAK